MAACLVQHDAKHKSERFLDACCDLEGPRQTDAELAGCHSLRRTAASKYKLPTLGHLPQAHPVIAVLCHLTTL